MLRPKTGVQDNSSKINSHDTNCKLLFLHDRIKLYISYILETYFFHLPEFLRLTKRSYAIFQYNEEKNEIKFYLHTCYMQSTLSYISLHKNCKI